MIDYGELHAPTCVPRTCARVEPQEESGMVALAPPVLRLLPHALLWTLMLHAIGRTIAAPVAHTAPASVPRVLQVHHVGDHMIDTGRHFLSVETIKRAIDGMATMKL